MVFVKIKKIKGRLYKYLVKGYRVNGKVKHKTIKYLGAVEPVNKKRKHGGGRKPHLFVRELTEKENLPANACETTTNSFKTERE